MKDSTPASRWQACGTTVVPPSAGGKTPRAAASRMSRKVSITPLLASVPGGRPTLADMIEEGTGVSPGGRRTTDRGGPLI
ncbi:hypothetical protein TUSST3_85370 [Streptomyces sp. TUS-ST3]|nr:hypothetical protein TUSST3_85370 [Streptomyces sp. TUS-ST3]